MKRQLCTATILTFYYVSPSCQIFNSLHVFLEEKLLLSIFRMVIMIRYQLIYVLELYKLREQVEIINFFY